MCLALAQIDAAVGDLTGNERRIVERLEEARDAGARLVLFPECAVSGYPAEDLLLKDHFLADCRSALDRIAEHTDGVVAIVGFSEPAHDVFNSAAVLADGELRAV